MSIRRCCITCGGTTYLALSGVEDFGRLPVWDKAVYADNCSATCTRYDLGEIGDFEQVYHHPSVQFSDLLSSSQTPIIDPGPNQYPGVYGGNLDFINYGGSFGFPRLDFVPVGPSHWRADLDIAISMSHGFRFNDPVELRWVTPCKAECIIGDPSPSTGTCDWSDVFAQTTERNHITTPGDTFSRLRSGAPLAVNFHHRAEVAVVIDVYGTTLDDDDTWSSSSELLAGYSGLPNLAFVGYGKQVSTGGRSCFARPTDSVSCMREIPITSVTCQHIGSAKFQASVDIGDRTESETFSGDCVAECAAIGFNTCWDGINPPIPCCHIHNCREPSSDIRPSSARDIRLEIVRFQ